MTAGHITHSDHESLDRLDLRRIFIKFSES